MFSILDRYIFRHFLIYFLLALFFAAGFLAVSEYIGSLGRYNRGFSAEDLFLYYFYSFPSLVYMVSPFVILVSVILTIYKLQTGNGLMVLFVSGASKLRIGFPILLIVGAISVFLFWVSAEVMPYFEEKKNNVYYLKIAQRPDVLASLKTRDVWYRYQDLILYISYLNKTTQIAEGVYLYYLDKDWKLTKITHSKTTKIEGALWVFEDGEDIFFENGAIKETRSFDKKVLEKFIQFPNLHSVEDLDYAINVMTFKEIKSFIEKNAKSGLNTVAYRAHYHSKLSFVFLCLTMAFIPLMFGLFWKEGSLTTHNKVFFAGLGVWGLWQLGAFMGRTGFLNPMIAIWFTPIIALSMIAFFKKEEIILDLRQKMS